MEELVRVEGARVVCASPRVSWAGDGCSDSPSFLSDPFNYIAQNPAKLSEAYWLVNQVSVFGIGGTPAPAPASPPPPTHDGGSSKIAIYFIIAASSLVVLCIGAAVWSRARDGSAGADDQLTRYGLAGACMSGCHVPRCIL